MQRKAKVSSLAGFLAVLGLTGTAAGDSASAGDKSGVSTQAIALPQGAGKVEGMGESFSTQLSTGVFTYQVPIALPKGRGGAQPSLALSYSSGSGDGVAGVGWDLGVPFIARETDKGVPSYQDPAFGKDPEPTQDRFVFSGAALVPLGTVRGGACAAVPDERMPAWANGWMYFRPRVEGTFQRFFWSPDRQSWRVQDKSGSTMELGVPRDESGDTNALETNPDAPRQIFRWNLARLYDIELTAGEERGDAVFPLNVAAFRYTTKDGRAYLSDIFYTPPTANAASAPLTSYANHVRLVYGARADARTSYRRGYAAKDALRLTRIDVTAPRSTDAAPSARELVRRYHLAYEPSQHRSLLASVQMEGRCERPIPESPLLPDVTGCSRLPALTLGYSHVDGRTREGAASPSVVDGWEPIDARVRPVAGAPNLTFDGRGVELFDANSDGLPDVLVTRPELFGGSYGLFLNGVGGALSTLTAGRMGVEPVLGATAATLGLANPNVAPADVDGDGKVDLVHMPDVRTYAVYGAQKRAAGWVWAGRAVSVASRLSPQVDLGRDAVDSRVVDVNGDGLTDVLTTKENTLRTFFSLGRFPGGDGLFGQAKPTSASAATLSTDGARACLPLDDAPVRLSDPDVTLADMNGDGLVDLVRVKNGSFQYWPGRGTGAFGTGVLPSCATGGTVDRRGVRMGSAPITDAALGEGLHLDDVNGDGLDDLVYTKGTLVQIWVNQDGVGFAPDPFRIEGAPLTLAGADNVRFGDMNGSGTRDIVWGDASAYRYMDLAGGSQPWLLTSVANGMGKVTEITFGSSAEVAAEAARQGQAWSTTSPLNLRVVRQVVQRNLLAVAGRPAEAFSTSYAYRDPYYDGREREFRGFREVSVRQAGDAETPPSTTRSRFALGECVDETDDAVDDCAHSARYKDNPSEALKGLPVVQEIFDDEGRYLSTSHTTYALRHLATGVDGRAVRQAFARRTDAFVYDVAGFRPDASTRPLVDVELEGAGAPLSSSVQSDLTLRSTAGRAHLRSETEVDRFGNLTKQTAYGCIEGCAITDEVIAQVSEPALLPHASGWLWRQARTYVQGSASGVRKDIRVEYDARGHAVVTRAVLEGSGTLDRFHADGGATAPVPTTRAQDGLLVVGAQDYNAFGQVVFRRGAENRCGRVSYDAAFGTFPVTETLYVGAVGPDVGAGGPASLAFAKTRAGSGCGERALVSSASYDRGLGAVSSLVGLHGEKTRIDYDGFGRMTALWKPHPYALGSTGPRPSLSIEYFLPADATATPFSKMHLRTEDGPTVEDASTRESWSYVDGFGRTVVNLEQADPSAGDGGAWVVAGLTRHDSKGEPVEVFQPWFWTGEGAAIPLTSTPASTSTRHTFDAFGREREVYGFDGQIRARVAHHAMATDSWDKAQLLSPGGQGIYATVVRDGHGRPVSHIQRRHVDGAIEALDTSTKYLATGELVRIARRVVGTEAPAASRWMAYDSLGRMVLNAEPNTSKGYVDGPTVPPPTMKAWRYVYDEAGELVGTSDARGCGQNIAYDTGGRLVAKDFSPCSAAQESYSAPDLASGEGTEVFYRYDQPDPEVAPGCAQDPALLLGRVASVSDRGAKVVLRTDGRGRVACTARKVARPASAAGLSIDDRYASEWFVQQTTFDAADRPARATTGATKLLSPGGDSYVRPLYSKRGTVHAVCASYGQVREGAPETAGPCTGENEVPLVRSLRRAANGRLETIVYGDAAETNTRFAYDALERLDAVLTKRAGRAEWTTADAQGLRLATEDEPTRQTTLEDAAFAYDDADNPVSIVDGREPSAWPAGAKPVSRALAYDDYYRVTRVDYQHAGQGDSWVSPFDAENKASGAAPRGRVLPSPHVAFEGRVKAQSFTYDALGNVVTDDDDGRGFYDRSLGKQQHGGPSDGPYQMRSATNRGDDAGSRAGQLSARYDAAGNLEAMDVVRDGPCLPVGATCSQHFAYEWDEVGRLQRARRWDAAGSVDESRDAPAADLRYAYDGNDERVVKSAVDAHGDERHTVYAFDGVELRGASFVEGAYEHTKQTEHVYLFANGVRLARVLAADGLPSAPTADGLHVFLELPDHLGSSSSVVDMTTGELVEKSTYQVYGGAESDYRPSRWASSRADYRFTGKEEDVEVGLQYFGKRYFSSALHRWLSADPLGVHRLGDDPNLYAYVHGRTMIAVDDDGLAAKEPGSWVDDASVSALKSLAAKVGADVEHVIAVMHYESGIRGTTVNTKTWTNRKGELQPPTFASGLIQWMPDEAQRLVGRTLDPIPTRADGESDDSFFQRREQWARPVVDAMKATPLSRQIAWASERYQRTVRDAQRVTQQRGESAEDFSARQSFYASFSANSAAKVYCVVAAPAFLRKIADAEWAAVKAGGRAEDADLSGIIVYGKGTDSASANRSWDANKDGNVTADELGSKVQNEMNDPNVQAVKTRAAATP